MVSLKISNITQNTTELVKRLRGFQSPGKKVLLQAIKDNDYESIITELLYRIELYTKARILNYRAGDLLIIQNTIAKFGLQTTVKSMVKNFVPTQNGKSQVQNKRQQYFRNLQQTPVVSNTNVDEIAENLLDYFINKAYMLSNEITLAHVKLELQEQYPELSKIVNPKIVYGKIVNQLSFS